MDGTAAFGSGGDREVAAFDRLLSGPGAHLAAVLAAELLRRVLREHEFAARGRELDRRAVDRVRWAREFERAAVDHDAHVLDELRLLRDAGADLHHGFGRRVATIAGIGVRSSTEVPPRHG